MFGQITERMNRSKWSSPQHLYGIKFNTATCSIVFFKALNKQDIQKVKKFKSAIKEVQPINHSICRYRQELDLLSIKENIKLCV